MTPQESTEIRNKRLLAAYNLEPCPDRVPVTVDGQGFFKFIDPTATIADYFKRPRYVDDLLLQAAALPDLDMDCEPGIGFVSEGNMQVFASMFFARMKFPGKELPDNSLWNVHETGPMTEADYDKIIAKGWGPVKAELFERIGFDPASVPPMDMDYFMGLLGKIAQLGRSSYGLKALLPFPPFEVLSGARKMQNFVRDIRRIPEKVRAAIDIIEDYSVQETLDMLKAAPPNPYGFIGGTRSGSTFISPAVYEKFYHPYFQKLVPAMQKIGVKTWFHNDNDWSGFLHYFREFPKGQCVFDPDQMTPILKIKEVLGDLMCIDGNISPALMSIGTPDQCYQATKEQISQMGKDGYIVSIGCSMPIDAKRENVAAVIAAAKDA